MNRFELLKFTNEGQDLKIIERIYEKIARIKAPNEKIEYVAIQKKPTLNLFPDSIILSSQRIYLCEFTNLGRTLKPDVFDWEWIHDIQIEEKGGFAILKIIPNTEIDYIIDYIPILQARKLLEMSEIFRFPELNSSKEMELRVSDESNFEEIENQIFPEEVHIEKDSEHAVEWDLDVNSTLKNNLNLEKENVELDSKLLKLKNLYDKQRITKSEFEQKIREYRGL